MRDRFARLANGAVNLPDNPHLRTWSGVVPFQGELHDAHATLPPNNGAV
jgi:hypothetical protein